MQRAIESSVTTSPGQTAAISSSLVTTWPAWRTRWAERVEGQRPQFDVGTRTPQRAPLRIELEGVESERGGGEFLGPAHRSEICSSAEFAPGLVHRVQRYSGLFSPRTANFRTRRRRRAQIDDSTGLPGVDRVKHTLFRRISSPAPSCRSSGRMRRRSIGTESAGTGGRRFPCPLECGRHRTLRSQQAAERDADLPFRPHRALCPRHTFPSESTFDLSLDGLSWMDFIARAGYDVYLVDVRGYGGSTRPATMSEPPGRSSPIATLAEAVDDVDAAVDFIRRRRQVERINLIGWSWGTAVMGRYAATHGDEGRSSRAVRAPVATQDGTAVDRGVDVKTPYRLVNVAAVKSRWLAGVAQESRSNSFRAAGSRPGWRPRSRPTPGDRSRRRRSSAPRMAAWPRRSTAANGCRPTIRQPSRRPRC